MSGCLVWPRYEGICLVSLDLVLSCLAVILGDLLFSEGGRGDLGERAYGRAEMSGGWGNCGWDILYEGRTYFQQTKKKRHLKDLFIKKILILYLG